MPSITANRASSSGVEQLLRFMSGRRPGTQLLKEIRVYGFNRIDGILYESDAAALHHLQELNIEAFGLVETPATTPQQ